MSAKDTIIANWAPKDRSKQAFLLVASVQEMGAAWTCREMNERIVELREGINCRERLRTFDNHVMNFHKRLRRVETSLALGHDTEADVQAALGSIAMMGVLAHYTMKPQGVPDGMRPYIS